RLLVRGARKAVSLPDAAQVTPVHRGAITDGESRQAGVVLVCDGRELRGGGNLDPDEIRSPVRGDDQIPLERAEGKTVEGDAGTGAGGGDRARSGGEPCLSPPDLVGRTGKAWLMRNAVGRRRVARPHLGAEVERGIPENIPLIAVADLARDLDANLTERRSLPV